MMKWIKKRIKFVNECKINHIYSCNNIKMRIKCITENIPAVALNSVNYTFLYLIYISIFKELQITLYMLKESQTKA